MTELACKGTPFSLPRPALCMYLAGDDAILAHDRRRIDDVHMSTIGDPKRDLRPPHESCEQRARASETAGQCTTTYELEIPTSNAN